MIQNWLCSTNPVLACRILRWISLFYVVPFGFVLIQLTVRDGYIQRDGLWQMNFASTGILELMYLLLGVVWIGTSMKKIIVQVKQEAEWFDMMRGNIPEDDNAAIEEFASVKKKLKIHGFIRLYRNDLLHSPVTTGIFFCKVILPYESYSRKQLRVIFHHELMHYKSHDSVYKLCGVYASVMQQFNVHSKDLIELLNEWFEYDCDRRAIDAMQDEMTVAQYYDTILDVKDDLAEAQSEDHIFSMLYDDQLGLGRRIDYMKKYSEIKKMAKCVTAALTFTFVMASVTTAYAAGSKVADVHQYLYKYTENLIPVEAETESETEMQGVQFIPAEEDDTYDEIIYEPDSQISLLLDENVGVSFNWSVASEVRHVSGLIKLSAGQKVSVASVASPASSLYWIGIMNTTGDVWYYSGTGSLAYTFDVPKGGSYRVLVQNKSSNTINAAGSYLYYTP